MVSFCGRPNVDFVVGFRRSIGVFGFLFGLGIGFCCLVGVLHPAIFLGAGMSLFLLMFVFLRSLRKKPQKN